MKALALGANRTHTFCFPGEPRLTREFWSQLVILLTDYMWDAAVCPSRALQGTKLLETLHIVDATSGKTNIKRYKDHLKSPFEWKPMRSKAVMKEGRIILAPEGAGVAKFRQKLNPRLTLLRGGRLCREYLPLSRFSPSHSACTHNGALGTLIIESSRRS